MRLRPQIDELGFAIQNGIVSVQILEALATELASSNFSRSRAGIRHLLRNRFVLDLASAEELMALAIEILGADAKPFRATLFDKSPGSNWLVTWHQDTALPLQEQCAVAGWGPWSVKDGVSYAHAPAAALERVVALRVHLDDSSSSNGVLRVLPGTHRTGVLSDSEIHSLAECTPAVECAAARGSVLLMRPLLLHASSKSKSDAPRRVLHIEYSSAAEFGGGLRLAVA